jgi:exodeoxyribonuclease VII large subunit
MSRLPFNPDRIPTPDVGTPAKREQARYGSFDMARAQTVSQITDLIKRVLADRLPGNLKVVGEVSNFSDRSHWYFSLKDEQNVLPCVMWARATAKCGFTPQRGQQVVATGRLDFYGPQGKLQLYVDDLQPVGQGTLELKFRQLCDELRAAGYFADDRKRPMPAFPQHIVVVTSANGAALHDVIRTAHHRWKGIRLSLFDVRVQGAAAAPEIAAAMRQLSDQHERLKIDAIILTRGGGSLEDLWAFNERIVADAVLECAVPIAAAIGHETDTTIAELVADLRCSTPTQAAARLVPDAEAEGHHVHQLATRLTTALCRTAQRSRDRLDGLARHPIFRRPTETIHRHRDRLASLQQRMHAAVCRRVSDLRHQLSAHHHDLARIEPIGQLRLAQHRLSTLAERLSGVTHDRLARAGDRLDALQRQLGAIGPQQVLQRGYTYTTTPDGQVIRSAADVQPAQAMVTHFADGEVHSTVDGPTRAAPPPEVPQPPEAAKPAEPRKPRRSKSSAAPGLFGE